MANSFRKKSALHNAAVAVRFPRPLSTTIGPGGEIKSGTPPESAAQTAEAMPLALLVGNVRACLGCPATGNARDFVNNAIVGGLSEIKSSELADTADASVKVLALMDKGALGPANSQLAGLAGEQKLAVSTPRPTPVRGLLKRLQRHEDGVPSVGRIDISYR
ncbi:hypothetical protein GCM10023067_54360 [Aminobacter aganoensis]